MNAETQDMKKGLILPPSHREPMLPAFPKLPILQISIKVASNSSKQHNSPNKYICELFQHFYLQSSGMDKLENPLH